MNRPFNRKPRAGGVFARLRRNHAGNTLAMMAIGLIPLAGLVGGAVDMSRIYLTKTRLQQACDAGALAGRKVMGGGTWAADNNEANRVAEQFFDSNFQDGDYGTSDRERGFAESAGRVTGTASAKVPMTLMKIFKAGTETISVTCSSEMRLPNTDVMFVLDTTGSMASNAPGDSNSKISGLRNAVKCFYEVVARLPTDGVCGDGGKPSGGTGSQVQIRFGFMPYATNVNVGRLLPTNWFADGWTYQTREQVGWGWSEWRDDGETELEDGKCNKRTDTDQAQYEVERIDPRRGSDYCRHTRRNWVPEWRYAPIELNVSGLKSGSAWNTNFKLPLNDDGSDRIISWDGCIEERATVRDSDYTPIPSDANDLNIDLIPSTGDPSTLWGPALPQVVYARRRTGNNWNQLDRSDVTTTAIYNNNVPYYCPTEARKLQAWPNASAFEDYVDGLTPDGNTYHDIGLIWGARFMSPTGIFRSENEFTPKGGEIQRHMIFMTDGDTVANNTDYGPYGFPWLDRRTTDESSAPSSTDLVNQVNARFSAICTAVKNQNITLWVVSYGDGNNTATKTRLQNCSTDKDKYFFQADKSTDLIKAFRKIADQISQLRLTQ